MGKNRKEERTLLLKDDLTVVNAEKIRQQFMKALAGRDALLLDLSKVGEMDTAGFQLLAALREEADKAGKEFRITAHSPSTLSVLKLYDMKSFFGIDADSLGILGGEAESESGPDRDIPQMKGSG